MKKTLHSFKFTKKINKAFYLLLFLLFSTIGFAQTITPTKIVTVAPGVCGALDVELKIQGSNPVARPLEVVLVIDVSGSMGDGNNPKPLSRAQDAAIDFINKMFLPANNTTNKNRVAIVTYSTTASIRRNLTLASGQADLISVINGLSANGSTNIQDGLVKAKTVLDGATYDCATARSIVLLTDGVANATGTNGASCSDGQQGTCIQSAITAATAAKTVTVSGTSYNNQIFSVGLFGAISGTEQTNAQYALNQIQSGGSFFTENAADLTGIYGQIFTQLSWVAKQIPSTAFEKETVDSNFIIGTVTPSKGTVTIVGQQINWNIDFLNVETITLKYRLTPKPNTCGNQLVSTSRLDFQNAACVTTFQNITSPTTNVPCPIITLASQTNVTCFGGNNGAITLNTPTGGQAPYTYKWTKNNVDFATTKDLTNLSFGTYRVTATDSNGCATGILTVEITQPSAALVLAPSSKTDVSCFGKSTGTVTAGAVTNSVGTVTYTWKNASNVTVGTTASVSNLPAGTYTLTVTDSCSSQSNSVTISQPSAALALAASSRTNVTCFGASTGTVTAGTVTNSVGTVTYTWKNASNITVGTAASVSNLPAGTYTLTVTDSCSSQTNSVTITQPSAALALSASSKTDVICFGASTGTVTAGTVTNSVGTVTYTWKNASNVTVGTSASVSNLPAGTYTLTVSDNCSSQSNSVTITQPSAALALAASSKTDVICFGASTGSVTAGAVTNSVGTVTYTWKNASNTTVGTTASVSNLPAGTYTLTVTDSCSSQTNSVTITQPSAALALAASSKTDVICFGASTGTVTAGVVTNSVGTVTYTWKNTSNVTVGTTASVSNLPAGTYTLTVTDSCSSQSNSVTISQPSAALALAASSKTDVTCYSASTGTVTAGTVTNSVGTVTYTWKNASNVTVGTTASVSNLPAGTYTLTVSDNCSSQSNSVTISQPSAALALAASSKTDVICFGASTGTVTAGTVTNFVGTVTYTWKNASNVTVGTTTSISNLPAGTYTLTVTDSCSSQSNSVTITQPGAALALSASSKTDVTCYSASTGTVTAGAVTNSVGTVTYTWTNSSNAVVGTTASVSNLPAGTYTLTVTDTCSSQTNSVTITQPSAALALAASSKTDVICFGASTGSVIAGTVTNSVGTLTYTWKNASNVTVGTTASVSNLPVGTYTLTVSDNCSSQSNSVTINQPSVALVLSASSKTDVTCYSASTGTVTAGIVTNSVGNVTYSWTNSSNAVVGNTASVSNLPAGTYTLTVSDNCSSQSNSVTITQPSAALALSASSKTDASCFGESTGTVTSGTVTNAVGAITYSWTNSSNTVVGNTASISNLPAGTYTLTVSDDCSSQSNSITISQPGAALTCSITQNKAVTANGLSNGEATVTPIGGNGNYTYLWDNNETTQKAVGLNAGLHIVTVTDEKGCTTTCSITITEPNVLSCSITQDSAVKCFGESNGQATVTAIGGNGDYTYLWDNNETTAQAVSLNAGLHTVTVTDKLGYTTTCSVTITQPQEALSATTTQVDVVCGGGNTGSATVFASGGTSPYTYSWNTNPAQTSATATMLTAGNYSVIVTDANLCTVTKSVTIIDGDSVKPIIDPLPETSTINCPAEPVFAQATATDNIGTIASLTYEDAIVPGNCTGSYTKTRTWTATDSCGNISLPVSQTIIVQDITAPIWTTQAGSLNQTIECSNAEALTSAQALFPTASDLCDADVSNIQKVSGQFVASERCSNSGTYTNTWTVKDDCGNISDTFTQIITIQDTTAPTWTTQAGSLNQTIECSNQEALTSAQALFPTASDLCDADVSNITKVSGQFVASEGCSNSGTYTNTWTVKDDCGNTSDTFTQVITIQDTTAPTWTTQAGSLNQTVECSNAEALTSAQALFPSASDLCDVDVSNITKISGQFVASEGCANSGTYTNTWTVKDDCGNTSDTFTQIITIQDTTAPTWTTQSGSLNQTIECSNAEALTAAQALFPTASDLCDVDVSNITKISGQFITSEGCANSGTYTNTWTVKDDCGNTSDTFTQVITIQDTTAPTWTTQAGSLNQTIECSNAEALTSAQALFPEASDSCDLDVSNITKVSGQFIASEGCANSGTYTNTWTVKDDCGNTSDTFTQIITIQDTTAPTWTTQSGSLNQTIECSNQEALTSAQALFPTASDLCDPDVSNITKVSGQFTASEGCSNSGTYTNTWTVKDDCGNTSDTFTQIITIQDTTAPTWATQAGSLNQTIECSNQEALTSAQALFPIASDSCDTDVSNITKVSGQFVASEGCSNSGTYINTWTVKDDCGNTSDTFTQIITIQDTTAPTWTTQTGSLDVTLQCADTEGFNNAQAQAPIAKDNCNGTVTYTKTTGELQRGSCGSTGTYTNTWTAKDSCNNTSTIFTQVITIQDTAAPTWVTQAGTLNVTLQCSDSAGLENAQNQAPTATANCTVVTYEKTSGQFSASEGCTNSGTYTNSWIAKDDCGNVTDSFIQIITIQDTTAPTWTTQSGSLNQTIECSNTEALTAAQALFPTASDLCDADVSNITKISGQFVASEGCANSGTYTNTWTVKDDCGNTSDTFTQIITIQDTTAPTWTTQSGSLNQTIECSNQEALTSAQALFPTASDLCDTDVSNITKISGQFTASEGCSNSGTYTNTWTVKDDCGNTSDTFTQIITIQDTTAPTWTTQAVSLNQTIECSNQEALTSAQALFPTASDLCDADVSNITKVSGQFVASEGCSNSGTYTNTWIVKDDCGNTSDTFTQIITIQDTTAPTWTTQAGSLNQTIECSNQEALTSAQALFPSASDSCDTDVSNITKVSGQFIASEGCGNSGTYTNTWTVKDDCGNTSDTFTQIITIQDTTAPTWTTQAGSLNQNIECSNVEALTSAQALLPTASDACDPDVSNITKISGQFVASEGCANSGTYTNTWTVKDDCGNTSDIFTQIITIQDTTAPTWATQSGSLDITLQCADTEGFNNAQTQAPIATDNCNGNVTYTKTTGELQRGSCGSTGTYTNIWTAKDSCNNTSAIFTQVITIQDTAAPTWITQAGTLNATLQCSDTAGLENAQNQAPTATANCTVVTYEKTSGQFTPSEGCSNAGTYTNSWIAKDNCGNVTDSFIQIITIQDTTPPTFTGNLPTDITVSCDAVPEPANLEASDNCSGDLPIVFSEIKSNILNECGTDYTLTRKWTTSDCGGNTVSHTQIIIVRDTTPPTGTAPADVTDLQSIIDIPAANPQAIIDAADNCSSTVTVTINDSNNGGSGCNGNAYILTRTYTLTDCAGNKTELVQTFTVENKVSVTGTATNVTCFGKSDGSILVTNSPGSTVVITNDQNEVVGNTNLPAGTYTLTATSAVNGENQTCTATTTVVITQPEYSTKISGYVMNVDNNSGIANVMVTLIPQGTTTGPILLRITGTDGGYSFTGMSAGSYLVQVQDATLNSVYQLYPTDSSLFFTVLEDCTFQEHTFNYGSSTLPVLGDYVWYDVNSNGIQDEWYDANNDGVVTKNVPDSGGGIDYSLWEWIDFNGDGSYQGPSNVGELNAGGFGNAASPNVIIDGPNGYHKEVIIGIEGYWRDRPNTENPYGQYTIKLVKDGNLDAMAAALGATGLVKVLPNLADKKASAKTGKIEMHTVCSTTSPSSYIVNVTPQDLVHLDNDFGINCKEYRDIVANDDSAGPIAGVNHTTTNVLNVLVNDTLEGNAVTVSDVIITTVTPNEFLQLNPDGSVDVLPNAPVGTLTLVYQICEADQTSNCDTATVTITIVAPVMTVTATPICVNDVPYIDYVVTPGNFTPVNGVTIAWANAQNTVITTMTNLPLSGRVLWPGAVVNEAGNGIDWPGWIFENNKWIQGADGFESLRPTVNLTISVNPSETITVNYPPADPYCIARPTFAIVANDDNPPAITAPAGVTNIVNVYNNDTLNNDPVNPADVTLTTVTPDPTNTITLNPDGSVDVAPNSPAGTYTLTYQICENADAGNCDTAIVTVIIVEPAPPTPVVANDDVYANIGCNTFGLVGNVLSNDFKGQLPATLELVNFILLAENENNAKTDPNITIDNQGNVTVSSLTPAGTYTYTYRICDKLSAENCDTATVTITVVPNGIVNITSEACNDDSSLINLSNLLPEGTPITGTWIDTNETNALQGNIFNPFGLALGNYIFEYKITDENCPRSVLLNMEVNNDCHVLACGNILVHNAFSPNGDGINDVFVIDSINDLTCYPENTVEIYNRWGILVFETSNYNNTTNAFDGTSRGRTTVNKSDGLPSGTYFYILTYKSLNGNNEIQNNKEDGYLYLSK